MPIHHTYISPRMGSTNRDTYGHGVRRNTGSTYHDHAVNGLKYWYEDTKIMPCKYEEIEATCITIMRSMASSIGMRTPNPCKKERMWAACIMIMRSMALSIGSWSPNLYHVSRKECKQHVSRSCGQWP